MRQNGLQLEIDEFDDPGGNHFSNCYIYYRFLSGQIISQIMEHCRRLSGSVNVDFPPQKLRPGYGTFVTELLHDLADAALKVMDSFLDSDEFFVFSQKVTSFESPNIQQNQMTQNKQ